VNRRELIRSVLLAIGIGMTYAAALFFDLGA
jgi:hypothetical protein